MVCVSFRASDMGLDETGKSREEVDTVPVCQGHREYLKMQSLGKKALEDLPPKARGAVGFRNNSMIFWGVCESRLPG